MDQSRLNFFKNNNNSDLLLNNEFSYKNIFYIKDDKIFNKNLNLLTNYFILSNNLKIKKTHNFKKFFKKNSKIISIKITNSPVFKHKITYF